MVAFHRQHSDIEMQKAGEQIEQAVGAGMQREFVPAQNPRAVLRVQAYECGVIGYNLMQFAQDGE